MPLPTLSQGSTLSIKSNVSNEPVHVWIHSEWRDSGHAELMENLPKSDPKNTEVELHVSNKEQMMRTSLGRVERHVSIEVSQVSASQSDLLRLNSVNDFHHSTVPIRNDATNKAVEKVILDNGKIHPDGVHTEPPPTGSTMKRVEYSDGCTHITELDRSSTTTTTAMPGVHLTVQVPEKINLICDLQSDGGAATGGGSITVSGKIEGDVRLLTSNGDIAVSKLRGHKIELSCGAANNAIFCKDLLESQSLIVHSPGRFRAKQIHGQSVSITVDPAANNTPQHWEAKDDDDEGSLVDIGALFVSSGGGGASIQVDGPTSQGLTRRAVRVKSHHGPLSIALSKTRSRPTEMDPYTNSIYPLVELGGVNGSCEVAVIDSEFEIENTDKSSDHQDWSSCSIHFDSVLPDSVSLITADRGDVSLTVDRKVEADLRLLSTSSEHCLVEAGALLADEEDSELIHKVLRELPGCPEDAFHGERVCINTESFKYNLPKETDHRREDLAFVEGWVDNQSREPDSRFDRKSRGEGKIRLDGAAAQALQSFSNQPASKEANTDMEPTRPLIAVASTRQISVETVSWIGAIARRYGLDEDHRGLGRTAARRGRSILPSETERSVVQ